MRASRRDVLLGGQTAMARKVYEAVPIQETWTVARIMAELSRLTYQMPVRNVQGALRALVEAGLIREPERESYKRVGVRESDNDNDEDDEMKTETAVGVAMKEALSKSDVGGLKTAPAPATKSPMEVLADLATRTKQLQHLLGELASDIETAALDVQQQVDVGAEEREQIETFKKLMGMLKK